MATEVRNCLGVKEWGDVRELRKKDRRVVGRWSRQELVVVVRRRSLLATDLGSAIWYLLATYRIMSLHGSVRDLIREHNTAFARRDSSERKKKGRKLNDNVRGACRKLLKWFRR